MCHEWDALCRGNICEGKISDGIADREFFFQFSASSAFHRCVNGERTAALYGARWSGSFSSPLTIGGTHVLFSSSKIKTSTGCQRKREGRESLFLSRNKGLSQTWLWAEISVTQLLYALYRGGGSVCSIHVYKYDKWKHLEWIVFQAYA